jgi:hypothetical protein
MTFDIEKARLETRGCENLIHFNNAGAVLMPKPVADYLDKKPLRESLYQRNDA